ncbi:MAG: L,D-transpeptidase [Rhodobacteraceae bacterium]|nr:L,D-transpeptidase [Paracoccaceae bacterium]
MTRRHLLGTGAASLALFAGAGHGQQVFREIHELHPGEFTWHPERQPDGPVAVVVSLDEQRVHVYRNGIRIAVSTCSTGRPGHETPTGVFVVLQKDRHHHSSTYNNAPMPNMSRLTWSGIALHAGNLPGYPASHGCVRLPLEFSALLFEITHLGTPVIIASSHSDPDSVVHPGFVLSEYSETEFEDVLNALPERQRPTDWTAATATPVTSIIASSHDGRLLLVENDREIAEGPLLWDGSPLGSHVFILDGHDAAAQGMRWHLVSYGDDRDAAQADLRRLRTDDVMTGLLRQHTHVGMLFVLTDLPMHPNTRTGRDFVIMS